MIFNFAQIHEMKFLHRLFNRKHASQGSSLVDSRAEFGPVTSGLGSRVEGFGGVGRGGGLGYTAAPTHLELQQPGGRWLPLSGGRTQEAVEHLQGQDAAAKQNVPHPFVGSAGTVER